MLILVANLGSTSFKCRLFRADGADEADLADGSADRIGQGRSSWKLHAGERTAQGVDDLADHGAAIELLLGQLVALGCLEGLEAVDAVGFKAVHGGPISGAVRVDEKVLETMQQFADAAPQHNPPYIAAMRAFQQRLPGVPQVAAFETAFHQTIPLARQVYGVPHEWVTELGVRRYGFHGASHRYIATRMAQIAPHAKKLVSCHLGGSCSICAIADGLSVANSFGMTAQTGVMHASRVGDFDSFALQHLRKSGLDPDHIWQVLGKASGLAGLSGVSSDMREVEEAAASGHEWAQLAVDAFVESCRHYIGAYLAVLDGADAIVFTGGIGQHGRAIRRAICRDMTYAGIHLDGGVNDGLAGDAESRFDSDRSRVELWIVPTNEELIVARQTLEVLTGRAAAAS